MCTVTLCPYKSLFYEWIQIVAIIVLSGLLASLLISTAKSSLFSPHTFMNESAVPLGEPRHSNAKKVTGPYYFVGFLFTSASLWRELNKGLISFRDKLILYH